MSRDEYLAFVLEAVRVTNDCDARHIESVPVHEVFQGQTVWQGIVEVYALTGHPKAKLAYAWAYDHEKGMRAICVLELPPVVSAITALRVGLVGEHKQAKGR